jgi:hypothetical protein
MQLTVSVDLLHSVLMFQGVMLIADAQVLRALSLHDGVFLVHRHSVLSRGAEMGVWKSPLLQQNQYRGSFPRLSLELAQRGNDL